jgi:dihydroneopterin aldolase
MEAAPARLARVFLRDLVLQAVIGVHRHEVTGPQRIVVNIDLAVRLAQGPPKDRLPEVVDYEDIANGVRAIVAEGHVKLVETLAERIAEFCLRDPRVIEARIRVEKPAAITDARGAGVEILRGRAR